MSSFRTTGTALLVSALTLAVLGLNPVAPARAIVAIRTGTTAKRPCHRGSVPIRLRGKKHTRTCLHLSSRTQQAARTPTRLFAAEAAALRIGPKHHPRTHRLPHALTSGAVVAANKRAQAVSDGLTGPRLPRLTRAESAARRQRSDLAARTTTQHDSKDFSQNGFTGVATLDGTDFEPDQGQVGEFGFDKTIHANAHKGTATLRHRDHERLQSDACPSVAGEVRGSYSWSRDNVTTVPYKGGTATLETYVDIDTKITGHTTAKGMLRDFDLAMTYHTLARAIIRDDSGTVVASDPPNLWTVHLSRTGLHLGDPFHEVINAANDANLGRVVGPNGAWDGGIPKADLDVANDAFLKLALSALRAGALLKTLENAWQDGACIDLDFTSSDATLSPHLDFDGQPNGGEVTTMAPGQLAHLTAHLKAARVATLAPGAFTTRLYRDRGDDKGTWTPMSGDFPSPTHAFTYAAPRSGWTEPSDTISISVSVTSHQGRALGSLDISPQAQGYRLVFTHTSDGDPTFNYSNWGSDDADGTDIDHEHLALSATSATLVPDATGAASGAGALTWQQHTWSTDDDQTANSGQDASIRCEIDTHQEVSAVQPGTMTVKSLVLGPAGSGGVPVIKSLDVVLAGVGETWQTTETQKSGPCPGFDSADNQNIFINRLQSQLYNGQPGVTEGRPGQSSVELLFDGTGWTASSGGLSKTVTTSEQPDFYNTPPQATPITWADTFRLEPVSP